MRAAPTLQGSTGALQRRVVFSWDERTQGILLGAFFCGFVTTQVGSGLVAARVGGKLLVVAGLSWMSTLTLLTPRLTTAGNFAALFVVRLLQGIGGVFIIIIIFFLTPVLNSRGKKKLRYAI